MCPCRYGDPPTQAGCRRFGGVFDHCLWQEFDQGVFWCVFWFVGVFFGGEGKKGGETHKVFCLFFCLKAFK